MCTVDCIKSCHFEEVSRNLMFVYTLFRFADYRKLRREASTSLMSSLLESVTIDAPKNPDSSPSIPNIQAKDVSLGLNGPEAQERSYDPSMLFLLEMATSLAIRDEKNMRDLSSEVAAYCTEILRQRKHLHPILVERTLIYLMVLKKRGHETVSPVRNHS